MSDDKKPTIPRGVIAIFTAPDGDVIATCADFDRSAPGGCKLHEGQKWRAAQQVKWAAVKAYCSATITKALGGYMLEQIADALIKDGHKIRYRGLGYPEDVMLELERERS